MNDRVMMSRLTNRAGPSSTAASVMISQRRASVRGSPGEASAQRRSLRWAFSTITTEASTMAPTAIAMPPKDMMLALMP